MVGSIREVDGTQGFRLSIRQEAGVTHQSGWGSNTSSSRYIRAKVVYEGSEWTMAGLLLFNRSLTFLRQAVRTYLKVSDHRFRDVVADWYWLFYAIDFCPERDICVISAGKLPFMPSVCENMTLDEIAEKGLSHSIFVERACNLFLETSP